MRTGRRLRIGEEFRAANEEDTSLEDDLGLPSRSAKSSGELLTTQVFELLAEVEAKGGIYQVSCSDSLDLFLHHPSFVFLLCTTVILYALHWL